MPADDTEQFLARHEGGFLVLEAEGELDLSSAAVLRRTIDDHVVDGRVDLVLDLRRVTFVDSVILGVFVAAHRKTRAFKGSFTLVVADGPVVRVLAVTGLERVLRRVETLDEAVRP